MPALRQRFGWPLLSVRRNQHLLSSKCGSWSAVYECGRLVYLVDMRELNERTERFRLCVRNRRRGTFQQDICLTYNVRNGWV